MHEKVLWILKKALNEFQKEKVKLSTKEQQESYENVNICYMCKEILKKYIWKIKNIVKVEVINIIYQNIEDIENIEIRDIENIAESICSLKYSIPKNIPIIFCNESNYDYHFIINELPKEFKKEFTC